MNLHNYFKRLSMEKGAESIDFISDNARPSEDSFRRSHRQFGQLASDRGLSTPSLAPNDEETEAESSGSCPHETNRKRARTTSSLNLKIHDADDTNTSYSDSSSTSYADNNIALSSPATQVVSPIKPPTKDVLPGIREAVPFPYLQPLHKPTRSSSLPTYLSSSMHDFPLPRIPMRRASSEDLLQT